MNTQTHDFAALSVPEPRTAKLTGFDADGWPLIDGALLSKSLVSLNRSLIGSEVLVIPLPGDPSRALIIGVIQPPVPEDDQGKTVIEADRELVLQCGKSSISLEKGGKVTVRGKQLLSRADGQNRVQGASVQLN